MADFTVGQTARASNYLLTAGQTWTRIASTITPPESVTPVSVVWNPTFPDLGGGAYEASYTVTSIGFWSWYGTATDGTPWTIEWDVDPGASQAIVGLGDNSLRSLRRSVAGKIPGEQVLILTATGGDTTSFRDAENLQGPNDAYKGADLYFVDGLNAGKKRRIISSDRVLGQLNWSQAVTAAVEEGDEAELWNQRGIGVGPDQVNAAINDAISSLAKHVWIPVTATLPDDFDQESPTFAVPAGLTRGIYSVNWQDDLDAGVWYDIDGGGEVPRHGWWYDAGNGVIQIDGWARYHVHGRALRVMGYGGTATLSADTDTTPIDREAVVTEAVSNLLVVNQGRNPDFERYQQRADAVASARRPFAVGRKHPNTVVF
jgi:hypothetical protein